MKIDIDANLIAQFLDALKTPHIAVIFGILGGLVVCGWIFIAYVKASKNSAIAVGLPLVLRCTTKKGKNCLSLNRE